MYTYIYIYTYVYVYIHIHIYVYVYYVYTYHVMLNNTYSIILHHSVLRHIIYFMY